MRVVVVFLLLIALYSITAKWSLVGQNVDTVATTLPGWHLVTSGDFDLTEYAGLNPWLVETPDGYWTNRPPGLVLVGFLAHLLAAPFTDGYGGGPGTMVAVLFAAAAVTIISTELGRLYGTRTGYMSAFALGVASATWPQASAELFPHAVGQLLMALTVWALARDRLWLVGVLSGIAITVRPPLAVVALALGVGLSLRTRHLRPMLAIGLPAGVGLAVLMAYNRFIFGAFSISGGYGTFVGDGDEYRTPAGYLANLVGTFFDGSNGLFVWSPWILITLIYLLVKRPTIEKDWVVVSAIAGVAYLLVHTGLNRHWGGLAFNYRYALEPLVLIMPLLAISFATIAKERPWRLLFLTALGVSVLFQAAVAFLMTCVAEGDVAVCTIL